MSAECTYHFPPSQTCPLCNPACYDEGASELAAPKGSTVEWRPMEEAPKDGTQVLLRLWHKNRQYAPSFEKHQWEATVRGKWIDHNGGGWTWSGMSGEPVAWAADYPSNEKAHLPPDGGGGTEKQ